MNVVPYDPLDIVEGVMKSVLRPSFDAFMERRGNGAFRTIPLDVAEDDTTYYVWADLPGVRKEDLNVSVQGNQLALSAQVNGIQPPEKEQGKPSFLFNERWSGQMSRTVEFTGEIDEANATAEYKDGVLALRLPKKPSSQVKRLTIH